MSEPDYHVTKENVHLLGVLDCIHDSLRGLANAMTAQEIRLSKLEKQLDSSVQMIESWNEIEKIAKQRQNESGYL